MYTSFQIVIVYIIIHCTSFQILYKTKPNLFECWANVADSGPINIQTTVGQCILFAWEKTENMQ